MKINLLALFGLIILAISPVSAEELDLRKFAERYFEAKLATQLPGASPEALERYLSLLTEDVGYEHKPYRYLGEVEGGKSRMRAGMGRILGQNKGYSAELVNVTVGYNAIAIQYKGLWSGSRGGVGPVLTNEFEVMEVLELVDGKVSIIRQYSKN